MKLGGNRMSTSNLAPLAMAAAALLSLAGCPEPDPVVGTPSTPDADATVQGDADATATPDAEPDAEPDGIVVPNPHSCLDPGELTYDPGDPNQCANSCLDENGKSKKTLCPDPISDWNCVEGCCLPVFTCQTDADCIIYGYDEGGCTDDRFDCRCDIGTGTCNNWYCGADSDCCGDETCAAGNCVLLPTSGLQIRIVSAVSVLTPGATTTLVVEAYDPANPDVTLPAGTITWASDNESAVAIADGTATGGTAAGTATITATADGGASDSITLATVLPPQDATLTVVTVVEGSTEPVAGRYALVDRGAGTTIATDVIPADGVISTTTAIPSGGIDVHVFGDNTEWVSLLGAQGPVVYLPAKRIVFGEIQLTPEAELVPDSTTLTNANILKGVPDFTQYPTIGEFEVSLSSFALSSSLLDFNIDAILGSEVRRYFDPDFPLSGLIDVTQESEIPGGLTFGLEGPAIPDFWLTAPGGKQTLWTLGGRAPASEVTPFVGDIINAVDGDTLDLGRVVTAVIPLFKTFYSAVDTTLEFPGDGTKGVTEVAPPLRVPLSLATTFTVPALPELEPNVWAEVVFMLGGALRADGSFVPMGLNAGADTTNSEIDAPDGLADGDSKTPSIDPYVLSYAPMHSGLSTVTSQYAAALVALSIDPGGNSTRRDAGSALLNRAPLGEILPAESTLQDFLPFANGSAYDETTRTLTIAAPAGAEATRVLFKGKQGNHWNVWLNGVTSYVVPVPADVIGVVDAEDRTTNTELTLVNSFDFSDGVTLGDLLTPGGFNLDRLLLVVDRVSFLDVRP